MRKRYSRSYTVLSFLTMFSYREQPSAPSFFVMGRNTETAIFWGCRPGGPVGNRGEQGMTRGIWGCILFKLKEYTPRPLLRPKGGCGPPLETPAGDEGTKDGRRGSGTPYLRHGLRRPNFVPKFGASVRSSCPTVPRGAGNGGRGNEGTVGHRRPSLRGVGKRQGAGE